MQAIPIHTIPVTEDNLLRFPVRGCAKYDKIKDSLRDTKAMKRLNERYQTELQALIPAMELKPPVTQDIGFLLPVNYNL